ncbi:DUF2066 domain-containing protein [Aquibaculum arenosum]|uniref:DUF2066 domain-containing protein n=1 Tax=Aquibaculum arenosum TaxID=3032591 RepID=A0ABT5YQC5_9PROT|nr:DUF2066 domain-containing protein [Fodinicurvata sp. CAU 1616]MDF2097175.1 DUF2066 domain-containing protein [Fodinicurvata sp. CAU 1616]
MSFPRFVGRLALLFSALFLALPAAAQDLYTVRGVAVEATASDATQAREAALAMGQSRALRRLWERLIPADRMGQAPSLSSERILNLIEDFGVSNERSGDDRYSAEMSVRFKPGEVRRILREANVPYAEQRGPRLLVVPLFADSNGTRLWEEPNPWRDAWARRTEAGLVPIEVPLGDLNDIAAIDAARAEALDRDALDAIAATYDAEEVLVSIARLSGNPQSGDAGLSIELRRIGPQRDGGLEMASLRQQDGEPTRRFYDRAVQEVDGRVQGEWKRANVLSFDRQDDLLVRVPINSLRDWVEVRRRLQGSSRVTGHEIRHLSRSEGIVSLAFVGGEEELSRALAARSLRLERLPEAQPGWPSWELHLQAAYSDFGDNGAEAPLVGVDAPDDLRPEDDEGDQRRADDVLQ